MTYDRPNERVPVDERDRKDYFTPSQDLFECHCQSVADRYCLHREMIHKENVLDIAYEENDHFPEEDRVFRISTDAGECFARCVVLAVGNGNTPNVAEPVRPLVGSEFVSFPRDPGPFPCARIRQKISDYKHTEILIVGGGLTSAQMADLAIERGVSKVWLLTRGDLKGEWLCFDLFLEAVLS